MDRSMIDAASGGALMDKTIVAARHQISNMARAGQPRTMNEIGAVDNLRLENQLIELTSLVRQLAIGQHQPIIATRVYGICTSLEHPTDMWPTLQETKSDHPKSVGAIGGYQYEKQPYQIQEATIFAKVESRAICSSTIRTCPKRTSRSKRLSTTDSIIPGTTVPEIATIESASLRQLTIFGGPDEVVSNKQPGVPPNHELQQYAVPAKYEGHHSTPQNTNRRVSKHCKPITIRRI
ncbi:hypothetical protein CR513_48742, partial [Mucuna pruriens]